MEQRFYINVRNVMIGKNLDSTDREELLKAPVYISLLAAVKDGDIRKSEKEMAKRITSLRSKHGDPLLKEYFAEVSENFSTQFDRMATMLPAETGEKTRTLGRMLERVRSVMDKLPEKENIALRTSLHSLYGKVEKADRNFVQYFLIPFGISESDDEMSNEQGPETRHYAP